VRSILDVAMSRFALTQQLRGDLAKAKADLESRKTVERAKGLLMKERGLDEDGAYRLLRKLAMDKRQADRRWPPTCWPSRRAEGRRLVSGLADLTSGVHPADRLRAAGGGQGAGLLRRGRAGGHAEPRGLVGDDPRQGHGRRAGRRPHAGADGARLSVPASPCWRRWP
jgi:hypothetical protein